MVHINGKDVAAEGMTLEQYLQENGYVKEQIAVECNEKIIPKAELSNKILQEGDVVEIVSFVGGGCR